MPFQRDPYMLVGRRARIGGATVALLAAAALVAPAVGLSASGDAEQVCGDLPSNVQCGPGDGRRTAGGGDKVSHKGWPAVTGVLWKVLDGSSRAKTGGASNDELLGHHGSDRLSGGSGNDILWGDWDPRDNNTRQRDILRGGAGNDYIYPSHGTTRVIAGAGNDYIWAFYGRGTIDCGPGRDEVRVRMNGAFKLRNCEVVGHFCQFGADGHGGCLKPGEKRKAAPRRRG
jgi:RTX calcium-binding nonapeptide repeat (4 copies)